MLQCPKCHASLSAEERSGVSVEACASCGGLWLDRSRLDAYVSQHVRAQGAVKSPAVLLASPPAPTSLPCPRCHPRPLECVKFRGIDVEQCPTCQGVFLAQEAMERLAERTLRAIQQSTLPTARAYGERPIAQGDWRSSAARCPHCGRTVYNRKVRHCGFCQGVLPDEILLPQSQIEELEDITADIKRSHASFMHKHVQFMTQELEMHPHAAAAIDYVTVLYVFWSVIGMIAAMSVLPLSLPLATMLWAAGVVVVVARRHGMKYALGALLLCLILIGVGLLAER